MGEAGSGRHQDEDADTVIGRDRLLAFGDAVFAIAITLLALDMTVPDGLSAAELVGALDKTLADVGAFLLSFVVIGVLWVNHHALFSRIARLDSWLLYLYLALLAMIAGLPFPTRLISEYGDTPLGTAVYASSIALAAALLTAMALRVHRRPALAAPGVSRESLRIPVIEGAVMVAVFATSIPLTLVSPVVAQLWWLLAIPLRRRLARG
ncbi:TMEM175 family protein [Streptomyces sp. 5K101]|uniref:TMEM175 family protein n=1 Tax=Streptomyces sp. 5K101 TaxID=3390037 RepID=UPI003975EB95